MDFYGKFLQITISELEKKNELVREYGTRIEKFPYQKFIWIFCLALGRLFADISSNTDCINTEIHKTPPSTLEK